MDQMLQYLQKNQDLILSYGLKLLAAIVIFYIGRWIAFGVSRLVGKALLLRKVDKAVVSFLSSIVYAAALIACTLVGPFATGNSNRVIFGNLRRSGSCDSVSIARLTVKLRLGCADYNLPAVQIWRFSGSRRYYRRGPAH